MHALNQGTLDDTFIISQIVDAIVISQNLLPPVETQTKTPNHDTTCLAHS